VVAHEVGHILNNTIHSEDEFNQVIKKLKKANHRGSKNITKAKDALRDETYADIHMQEYQRNFIAKDSVLSHFCHYSNRDSTSYTKHSSYLQPYHRQALINCSQL
jgi:hypothetical protein